MVFVILALKSLQYFNCHTPHQQCEVVKATQCGDLVINKSYNQKGRLPWKPNYPNHNLQFVIVTVARVGKLCVAPAAATLILFIYY